MIPPESNAYAQRSEVEALKKSWADAADHVVSQRYEIEALKKENETLRKGFAVSEDCVLDLKMERSQLRVALANVSGALCDSGVVVPGDERRFGEAIRLLTKERDEARSSHSKFISEHNFGVFQDLRAKVERLTAALKRIDYHASDECTCGDDQVACWGAVHKHARAALSSSPPPVAGSGADRDGVDFDDVRTIPEIENAIKKADDTFYHLHTPRYGWIAEFRRALGIGDEG